MSKEAELQEPVAADTRQPAPEMAIMKRALLVPSKTNPRTDFTPEWLQELAADIKARGVLQPLLVRPLPASRVQDTAEDREPGAPLPTHEIVCGECRWRSSGIAGLDDLPVMVRPLTDDQAIEAQLVENLKRKSLHPLEEAEGYDRLIRDHRLTVSQVAERIQKSASYVYKALKLLELTPECRTHLAGGKLDQSTALLVARAPAHLQAQIAREIMAPQGMDGEHMSFRQAQRHIQDRYMLQLATAVFNIADASLVPKAGDCKSCPKRTGANTDLFDDVKSADTCTDPKCFDAKKEAHFTAIAKAAAAKGQKVIMGKEAKELMPYAGSSPKGFTLLDEKNYVDGRTQSLRTRIKEELKKSDVKPVLILNPHTKQLQEALPVDVAGKLVQKASNVAKKGKKEPTAKELQDEVDAAYRTSLLRAVHRAIEGQGLDAIGNTARNQLLRVMATRFAEDLYDTDETLAEVFGQGKVASRRGVVAFLEDCTPEQLHRAVILVLLGSELEGYEGNRAVQELVAGELSIDLKALADAAKAAVKERHAPAPEKEPAKPAGKAAKATKKTSAKDAQAGIAKALQEQDAGTSLPAQAEPRAGARIRVKDNARGPTGHFRKCRGKEGELVSFNGSNWIAKIDGSAPVAIKASEFDVLPEAPKAAPDGTVHVDSVETAAWPIPTEGKDSPTLAVKKGRSKAKEAEVAMSPAPATVAKIDPVSAWPFPKAK